VDTESTVSTGTDGAGASQADPAGQPGGHELLALPDVAERLGMPVTRVHQLLRDGQLVAVRPDGGPRRIPASFVQDGLVVKALPAVITQLRDARYSDEEIVDWMHRPDPTLQDGTAIAALRANHGTEVRRRAQVAGY
jgi:excisionase family DNA binding protein